MLQRSPRRPERAVERDVEHTRPLVVRHLDDVGFPPETGVVDDDVETVRRGDRSVEHRVHLPLVGDVAHRRRRAGPHDLLELLGGLAEAPLVLIAQHHDRALLGAALRSREADTRPRRRRDEHGLAVEERVTARRRRRGRGHVVTLGSAGSPRARSPMTLRWIWFEPP